MNEEKEYHAGDKLHSEASSRKSIRKKIRVKEDYVDREQARESKLRAERAKTADTVSDIEDAKEALRHERNKAVVKNAAKKGIKTTAKIAVRTVAAGTAVSLRAAEKAANNSDNRDDEAEDTLDLGRKGLNENYYSKKLKQSRKDVSKAKNLEETKASMSNQAQKEAIKKSYAARKRHQAEEAAGKGTGSLITKASEKAKQAGTAIIDFVKENPRLCLLIAVIGLLILFISCMFNACSMSAQMLTTPMVASSYTAQDDDILAVEANYTAKETDLRNRLSRIETDYPDYDEYRYELAEIGHDPYQLASYLTAVIEDYTPGEAASYLNTLFDKQYKLTLTPVTEIRYRTVTKWHWVTYYREETRTGYRWEGGKLVPYTYTVEVPYEVYESYQVVESYEYYILKVKLTNTGLDSVIRGLGLSDDQLERYGILLQTKGNKSYLFEDSIYANQSDYLDYDIPGEALTDRAFANMIHEAEKYLGYPYVWGGSSPSTSFDCSGFVSYVINNCGNGWNVGRQTANGLKNTCSIIRPEEAKPGDLIFFQGTYDTAGASHVGIYVGNNMMIHCGNPISYAHTDTSYWQSHFYCYGRLP